MSDRRPPEQYEQSDLNVRQVVMIGAVLAVSLLVVMGLMVGLSNLLWGSVDLSEGLLPEQRATPLPTPPPGEQPENAIHERLLLEGTQEALLGSYGWVDEEGGVARIPIDRAMTILLEQGLPTPVPTAAPTVESGE